MFALHAEERGAGAGRIIHPVRLAVTGGPSLFDMMEVLGKETCVRRIRKAVLELGKIGSGSGSGTKESMGDRYVNEFAGLHNPRSLDTIEQMVAVVRGMDRKRLRYADLIA